MGYNIDDYLGDDEVTGGSYDSGQFTGGSKFPFIQWVDANPLNTMMPQGGFFWQIESFPSYLTPPWQQGVVTFANSGQKYGYLIPHGEFLILASRLDWGYSLPDGTKRIVSSAFNEAKAQAPQGSIVKGRTRYLVLVKGAEAAGPVMLTMWGTKGKRLGESVSAWFREWFQPAAEEFAKRAEAAGKSGLSLPPFASYVPLMAGMPEKANPKFPSMITPVILPPAMIQYTREQRIGYVMGNLAPRENIMSAKTFWEEAQAWAKAPLTPFGEPDGFSQAQQPQAQQGYGAPPPAQQGYSGYGAPPPAQQGYGQGYGAPPPAQPQWGGQPPQGPPPQQWGAPPPAQPQWGGQPPQGPPPQQWGAPPPAQPPAQGGGQPQPFRQDQNGQPLATPPWG